MGAAVATMVATASVMVVASDSKWLKLAGNKITQNDFTSFTKKCLFKFTLLPFPLIAWATYPNFDPSISRIFRVEYLVCFCLLVRRRRRKRLRLSGLNENAI